MQLIKAQIRNDNGNLYVSSRAIAKGIKKNHKHVLRDIEKIIDSLTGPNLDPLKKEKYFLFSEYKDRKGEMRKEVLMTKKGFTLYMFNIQGYNDFKIAYIDEFERMEKLLNSPDDIGLSQATVIEKMTRRNLTDTIKDLGKYGNYTKEHENRSYIHFSNLSRKVVRLPRSKILPKNKMSETQIKLLEGAENYISMQIIRNIAKRVPVYEIYENVKAEAENYFNKFFSKIPVLDRRNNTLFLS